jgi:DNA-binding NarL/FixJ family response regulator
MTFLIAEDSLPMRQHIKRFLLKHLPNHHTFYEASDGREAVQLFECFSPDWVLMDIQMVPVDGITASKEILGSHPAAKIIVLTSYYDAGYRKAAHEAGTVAFVSKDHLEDLQTIFSSHLPDHNFS